MRALTGGPIKERPAELKCLLATIQGMMSTLGSDRQAGLRGWAFSNQALAHCLRLTNDGVDVSDVVRGLELAQQLLGMVLAVWAGAVDDGLGAGDQFSGGRGIGELAAATEANSGEPLAAAGCECFIYHNHEAVPETRTLPGDADPFQALSLFKLSASRVARRVLLLSKVHILET